MRFLVIGSGFQGRACAYDMLRNPATEEVILADADAASLASAKSFLAKVAKGRLTLKKADAAKPAQVQKLAKGVNTVVSCVPYFLNYPLAKAALAARANFVDLGGNTDIVRKEIALHPQAVKAGVSILPDNGLGPGMISTLAVHAIQMLDQADEVLIYDGGLPQRPVAPLNYMLTFSEHGLINEYAGEAKALKDGKLVTVPALSELDVIDVPGLGRLEAGHASGGLSTLAETYQGRVKTMFNKFFRYPGHIPAMVAMNALGYFGLKPVEVKKGVKVVPRDLSAKLFRSHFHRPGDEDIVVIHNVVRGLKNGRRAEIVHDLVDRYDRETSMTAMMRTTAFPASIVAQMAAQGQIKPGAYPVEVGVPPEPFIAEARKRGFDLKWTFKWLDVPAEAAV
jgi:lysine 6-dehydrogenase